LADLEIKPKNHYLWVQPPVICHVCLDMEIVMPSWVENEGPWILQQSNTSLVHQSLKLVFAQNPSNWNPFPFLLCVRMYLLNNISTQIMSLKLCKSFSLH